MIDVPIPEGFRSLPIPMPPMLPDVVGVTSDHRFFRLNYEGAKACWSDGRAGSTFSYYAAYEPYVNHLAMAIHLLDVSLGHDDAPATHSLFVDRLESVVYVGAYKEVCRALQAQHPPRRPPTPAEIEEWPRPTQAGSRHSTIWTASDSGSNAALKSTPHRPGRTDF